MKRIILLPLLVGCLSISTAQAEPVSVELQLPVIGSGQYKRPFVAVWVERKGERKALQTLALWYDDKKWLKDVRRWWRKAGRYEIAKDSVSFDGVTAATRAPGKYTIKWDGRNKDGELLSGAHLIYMESVREHGNRTLLKQEVHLGDRPHQYEITAGTELGPVQIKVGE
ncbi:DUF2271 domain-containing protein [Neptunomonas japonica]|uniref:DUF2271 domain-containing protein n=1 Tax=Neptunomonas japonica TaxID=417574 RepID=UPI00041799CA|nr:DUF2271 domain-containing protein [Neptunomonas japonica]